MTTRELLEMLECEIECIENHDDYVTAMDCIEQLKDILEKTKQP